ncbi:MAG: hypothetical protein IT346_04530, partial [Epsilonproteobacteria bacterium]|nr:hypothetical protein [Campylobacterota bacterium]
MKKSLVVALGCLVSFAARAEMFVEITVQQAGQEAITKAFGMNEVAEFVGNGVAAQLTPSEQDGAVVITATCSRVQENGETACDTIPSLTLAFDDVVTLVDNDEIKVQIVARTTDAKTVCAEEVTEVAAETTTEEVVETAVAVEEVATEEVA